MRRTRIDLGQKTSAKEETNLNRKRKRWAERNKDKDPEENPFLQAIKPDQENFGYEDEQGEKLIWRLSNLEFGNFPGYYNYRNKASVVGKGEVVDNTESTEDERSRSEQDNNEEQRQTPESQPLESGLSDERLKFFQPQWFEAREVLDIGCNRGHITYAIARLFRPKSIVGIDIDVKMINMANKDLHLHLDDGIIREAREDLREQAAKHRLAENSGMFPISSYIMDGPLSCNDRKSAQPTDGTADHHESANKFPNNIAFVEHNYVLSRDELVDKQKPHFDTIVCLSVTKWIHLNYCDAGLKRFFKRIYRHLRPGGLLILESQPFDNYGRRKKLSDRLRANFYSIQFHPEQFDNYLLSEEVGFKSIVYQSVTDHQCVGFKRPLKVFSK